MNNNHSNNNQHLNNFINNIQNDLQNNQPGPLPNVQQQHLGNQVDQAQPNSNQQDMLTQQQLSRMNSKLQRSGILMQNLAVFGERSAQQGTCGSQIFQDAVRNRSRQRNDEIRARRGGNKCISLQAGQELNQIKNTKRQTEQVMQAAVAASGFCSSLKSSIDGVDLDDKAEEQLNQLDADSLNINANLLMEKQRKGPGYHSKFSRQLDRMTKQKDTHKPKDNNSKHVRVESIQISLNIKNTFPSKLHLQPLTSSPNKLLKAQQRPITCMSEGYQRERAGESSRLVHNAPSSLHLSPLAREQSCCPYNCFNPFTMGDNSFDIPAALFLNLICHHVNMPDEHAIVVLALIDRFCNKVVDLNYHTNRFYKRLPNESRQQDTGEDIPQVKHCCSQMTINPQTIHKLILTSALVTQKFYSDIFYSNNYFTSRCGFIEVEELNRLEEIFLDVIDWNLTVDFEEYQTYDSGLQQFFEAPLQPETIRIIDENHEAYNNLIQNQNQQMFNQEFEQWSHQSAQRLQMLERIIQQQQQQGANQVMPSQPFENNNTGETSEMRQTTQSLQLLQELMDNGVGMNQAAALNLGQNQQGAVNLAGMGGVLPSDFAQQHAGIPNPNQDASQLNMHLLNIAIACEMQRQQSLNQQISILASLLQQLQLHEQQQQQNNQDRQAPLP